ncbi:predicted GPI-anchored protein 58 [Brachypodium distachyon]|uniref:predicted GPI-anchored protein 58 n=1 Tax=Brachypodium distachyon TaxID=15368 RepID=UPI00071D426C|nr:predicted GPI-anchored protein 58 [Brachypodium distachyon]|eukprot:XP_014757847.1 predicted GPI-anchored protein 58 [Brachypodium distachyon]
MSSSVGGSGRSTWSGKPLDATVAGSGYGGTALPPSGPHHRGRGRTRSAATPPPTAADGATNPAAADLASPANPAAAAPTAPAVAAPADPASTTLPASADPAPTADATSTASATPATASTADATTTAAVPAVDTTTATIPTVTAPAQFEEFGVKLVQLDQFADV